MLFVSLQVGPKLVPGCSLRLRYKNVKKNSAVGGSLILFIWNTEKFFSGFPKAISDTFFFGGVVVVVVVVLLIFYANI